MKDLVEILKKSVEELKKVSEIAQHPSFKKAWGELTPEEQKEAFNMFTQSYKRATGEAWDESFFRGRARNWLFYGNRHGFVAVRPQKSGMLKIVGSAGHPAAIQKGMQHVLSEDLPTWAAASPELAAGLTKHFGMKAVPPAGIKAMAPLLADHGVLGDAKIHHIEDDGTIHLQYPNLQHVTQKQIVGNHHYHNKMKPYLLGAQGVAAVQNVVGAVKDKFQSVFGKAD